MTAISAPRVFVIDNDPRVCQLLDTKLTLDGYQVCVAEGSGTALLDRAVDQAQQFRPHVAIVDVRLVDEYVDEHSGLALLPKLRSARCILFSAHLDTNITLKAREHAAGWAVKIQPEVLYGEVKKAAEVSCAHSRGTHVQWPASWSREEIIHKLFAGATQLPDVSILDDLIAQLFPEQRRFYPETISGAVSGLTSVVRGRSAVFKLFTDAQAEPKVVKFGNAERIAQEEERYRQYVKDQTPAIHATRLEASSGFWDLGGAVYSFIGANEQSLPTFTRHYTHEHDMATIVQPLHYFFTTVWGTHYAQLEPLEAPTLFAAYDDAFQLRDRLSNIAPELVQEVQAVIPFATPDPVAWVREYGEDSTCAKARQAVTHGDLHGDNLFVEGNSAWIIDFERTGPSHALRDFVELEVDIFTRLAQDPQIDRPMLLALASAMVQPGAPTTPVVLTPHGGGGPAVTKAVCVINEVRQLAQELVRYSDQREYLWGLLFDALFIASVRSAEREQKWRALLLSAVICERLRTWGNPWPPVQ